MQALQLIQWTLVLKIVDVESEGRAPEKFRMDQHPKLLSPFKCGTDA